MTTQWNLVSGPSKFDVMASLFDNKVIAFQSDDGNQLFVRVASVTVLKDHGHDAWRIQGCLVNRDDQYSEFRECNVLFSSRDRHGILTDNGPKDKKDSVEYWEQQSDWVLIAEIASYKKFAHLQKQDLDQYMRRLTPHEQLVVEVLAVRRIAHATKHTELDHEFYVSQKSVDLRPRKS